MTRPVRLSFLLAGVVVVPVLAALAWFGSWYYPALGLAGIARADYRQAMEVTAQSVTRAKGFTLERFDFMKYRPFGTGDDAYAWGEVRCRAAAGSTAIYWISLEWSTKRGQWLRGEVEELATPDDEIYFSRHFPEQITRARLALHKILGRLLTHIREAQGGCPAASGLPTPGL